MSSLRLMKNALTSLVLGFVLSACGGAGNSESGSNADFTTSGVAGVYGGSEFLKLVEAGSKSTIDTVKNEVTITISESGNVRLSSSAGSTGSAQLRQDYVFSMRSNAKLQFGGQCEAGTIVLIGSVRNNKVTANYHSELLRCGSKAHELTGQLSAKKRI